MARQRYVGMEFGGGTRPQFDWEEMPGWGTSVDEDVVDVHCSPTSDSRVLVLMMMMLLLVLVLMLMLVLVLMLVFLWVWGAL